MRPAGRFEAITALLARPSLIQEEDLLQHEAADILIHNSRNVAGMTKQKHTGSDGMISSAASQVDTEHEAD